MKEIKINKAGKVDRESWGWGSPCNRVIKKDHAEQLILRKDVKDVRERDSGYLGKGVPGGGNSRYRGLEAGSQPRDVKLFHSCAHCLLNNLMVSVYFVPILQMRKLSLHCDGTALP